MKKSLISTLTTVLVVGAASTTFAAANPFEDVPADHWAYDAVAQLAADGVIEGYGDGTYRGDQEITRYEMAQMVARAMAKGSVSGADKAMIDKLAAEFADELKSLGVRVAALEKKVDNVRWQGTVRYRYITDRHYANNHSPYPEDKVRTNYQYVTLRLEPEMRINKHWTGHARIDYNTDMNSAVNTTGNVSGWDVDTNGVRVERIWAQGDYGRLHILLGKLPYITNVDDGMLLDDNVSGGQITFGNKVKATITVGRWNEAADLSRTEYDEGDVQSPHGPTGSYQGIEIYNDRDDRITWGVGYHHLANRAMGDYRLGDGKKAFNIWEVGLGWKMTDTLALRGAYAWNTAVDESLPWMKDSKRAFSIELAYKGANPTDKGSWGAFIAYRRLGSAAVLMPTYDAIGFEQQGFELGLDYVLMKNCQASFKYFTGKDLGVGAGKDDKANTFFTELNFFF